MRRSRQVGTNDLPRQYRVAVEAAQISRYAVGDAVWIGRADPELPTALEGMGVSIDIVRRPSDVTGGGKRYQTLILSPSFSNQLRSQAMLLMCELVLQPDGVVILTGVTDAERVLQELGTGEYRPDAFGASGLWWGNSLLDKFLGANAAAILEDLEQVVETPRALNFLAWIEAELHPHLPPWLCSSGLVVLRQTGAVENCIRDWNALDGCTRCDTDTIRELLGERFDGFHRRLTHSMENRGDREAYAWVLRFLDWLEIEVDLEEIFHESERLKFAGVPDRLLFIPDLCDEEWPQVVVDFVTRFRGRADVELVVRIDIDEPELQSLAVGVLTGLVDGSGVPAPEQPSMVLELRPFTEQQRFDLVSSCGGLVGSFMDNQAPTTKVALDMGLPRVNSVAGYAASNPSSPPTESPTGSRAVIEDGARPPASVLVVTFNSAETIEECLYALARAVSPGDEVVVVDNASEDDTLEKVLALTERTGLVCRVIRSDRNLGFARGVNLAAAEARNELFLFLNPDTSVSRQSLDRMARHLLSAETVGAVGVTSDYASGDHQASRYIPQAELIDGTPDEISRILVAQGHAPKQTNLLIGFCLMIEKTLFEQVGRFPKQLFAGSDDLYLSFCLRNMGYQLLVATDVFIRHVGQVSFESCSPARKCMFGWHSQETLYELIYKELDGEVPSGEELFDIKWFTPNRECTSIVIPASPDPRSTRACLERLKRTVHRDLEVILVGELDVEVYGSFEGQSIRKTTYVRVPPGTSRSVRLNQGLAVATGEYIVCLDESADVPDFWLSHLIAASRLDTRLGILGPSLPVGPAEQRAAASYTNATELDRFTDERSVNYAGMARATAALSSSCMLILRRCLDAVGGFDPHFLGQELSDQEYGLRAIAAGLKAVVVDSLFVHTVAPAAEALVGGSLVRYDRRVFEHKHGGFAERPTEILDLLDSCQREPDVHIPLTIGERCRQTDMPLPLLGPNLSRVLLIPDWENSGWQQVFRSLAELVSTEEGVGLLVRVENPLPDVVELATQSVRDLLKGMQSAGCRLPSVVLETSRLAPDERGQLYRAAVGYVPCGGRLETTYIGEAEAAGIPVLGAGEVAPDPEQQLVPALSG